MVVGALVVLLGFSGCATTKDLQQANSCKVWTESAIGNEFADLEDGHAIVRKSCLWGNTGCDTKETYFVNGTEIHMTGKLAPFSGKVAEWSKGKLAMTPPGPFKAMKPDKIVWQAGSIVISTTVLGHTGNAEYFFNQKCTPEQAALGTIVLAYSR